MNEVGHGVIASNAFLDGICSSVHLPPRKCVVCTSGMSVNNSDYVYLGMQVSS